MLDNSNIRIHPSVDTVLGARLLGCGEFVLCDSGGDAFLEADFGEVVDGCTLCIY
jgi:hypothetical protein